ncbi:hypothetical protein ABEB36_010502 [Hypothenemus hampei]|uniref:Oxidoreductase-like domain-containing protein n=1 Tax=Hypothenemus hampei TaxID=57062 RepID=A0ABD1EJZ2_HYPHA
MENNFAVLQIYHQMFTIYEPWNRDLKYLLFYSTLYKNYTFHYCYCSSKSNEACYKDYLTNSTNKAKDLVPQLIPPEEPTTCCMSGCANCVWLDYAEKLTEYYKDGGEKSVKEINDRISDPNIKAYLLHEIRMKSKTE